MIELYQRADCPFSRKVRVWLARNNLDFVAHNQPKLASERRQLLELTDNPEVPLLKDGDTVLQGSDAILGYLQERYGRPGFGDPTYGLTRIVPGTDLDSAEAAVVEALKSEGFGVLTRIDVRETMRQKLDVDFRPYVILGACNPPLAHLALSEESAVGLLLPCNVVVAQNDDHTIAVSAVDPIRLLGMVDRDDLEPLAQEVKTRLKRVLAGIHPSR